MAGVGLDVDGIAAAKKTFDDLQNRMKHMSPAYQRAGLRMYRDVIDHFKTETNPDGSAWEEWSPQYAEYRKNHRGGTKKLQDTGLLRASILFTGLEHDARVYTEMKYAAIHNFGGVIGPAFMPARTFMWLSDMTLRAIEEDWAKWLIGEMSL